MNSLVHNFEFDNLSVRVVDEDGEPWFNANDVCAILGMGNPWQAIKSHVDEDDLQKLEVIDSMNRPQSANHINESGLYALIFGSTKPEAKRFKKWVTSEVLPQIRKTGSYNASTLTDRVEPAKVAASLASPFMEAALAFGFEGNQARLSADQAITGLTGVSVLHLLGQKFLPAPVKEKTLNPTELGQALEPVLSPQKVNMLLAANGLQAKVAGHWTPTEKGLPYCEVVDTTKKHATSGAPVKQVRWYASVVPVIQEAA